MSRTSNGIGIGDGVALSKAFVLKEPTFEYPENSILTPEEEKNLFLKTQSKVGDQVKTLIDLATKNISPEKGEIFQAHLNIVEDEQIKTEIFELLDQGKSQAWAIATIFDKYVKTFEDMDNPYFRERASDVKDLKKRFLSSACNVELPDLLLIKEECIIVTNDLTPSETAMLNRKFVRGFVTNIGGATSHSAIMARTLEIPAVVSLKNITETVSNGEKIAVDAKGGIVESNLSPKEVEEWKKKVLKSQEEKKELELYKNMDCKTSDGFLIPVKGNIGQPKDLQKVIEWGGKGVGLFRSEFLYMESQDWPTEEEQFKAYREVLEGCGDHEVTIRTLDIGGDKNLNYFNFPKEMNPFLGYRALRLCLRQRDIFETQIRALLRSSVYGKLKIMFPMVTTFEEFLEAKRFTKETEAKLRSEGIPVSDDYKIGMMVEIPSSALLSSVFARESDFFSIGSNDLIQYTHAVDRMSEEVNYLYQPNCPSILRLIKMTVDGSIAKNREVSVCGEMASNPISAILLVGLGVNSLSMSATAIPRVKRVIGQLSTSECRMLAEAALNMATESEVMEHVEEYLSSKGISR